MKDLNEYPTPITDFVFAGWIKSHPAKISHAKLERKLAACREFMQDSIDYSHFEEMHKPEAEKTLSATAP